MTGAIVTASPSFGAVRIFSHPKSCAHGYYNFNIFHFYFRRLFYGGHLYLYVVYFVFVFVLVFQMHGSAGTRRHQCASSQYCNIRAQAISIWQTSRSSVTSSLHSEGVLYNLGDNIELFVR